MIAPSGRVLSPRDLPLWEAQVCACRHFVVVAFRRKTVGRMGLWQYAPWLFGPKVKHARPRTFFMPRSSHILTVHCGRAAASSRPPMMSNLALEGVKQPSVKQAR